MHDQHNILLFFVHFQPSENHPTTIGSYPHNDLGHFTTTIGSFPHNNKFCDPSLAQHSFKGRIQLNINTSISVRGDFFQMTCSLMRQDQSYLGVICVFPNMYIVSQVLHIGTSQVLYVRWIINLVVGGHCKNHLRIQERRNGQTSLLSHPKIS